MTKIDTEELCHVRSSVAADIDRFGPVSMCLVRTGLLADLIDEREEIAAAVVARAREIAIEQADTDDALRDNSRRSGDVVGAVVHAAEANAARLIAVRINGIATARSAP